MQTRFAVPTLMPLRARVAIFVVSVVFLLPSCKNKEESRAAKNNFKMNCLILKKDKLQAWVDKARSKSKMIKLLLLQFHSKNTAEILINMQEIAYPGTSLADVGAWGSGLLEIDSTCVAVEFKAATFANNTADLLDMKVIKADTTLADFDFIRFKPSKRFAPMISYDVEIVRTALNKTEKGGYTNPCPPCQFCVPPCVESIENNE